MTYTSAISQRRTWAVASIATVVFNTVVAMVLTAFAITPGDLGENLVYSHCIGLLVLLGMLVPSTLIWREKPLHPIGFSAIAIAASVFGVLGGRALAGWLLGHSVRWNVLVEASTFMVSLGLSAFAAFAATFYFWSRERDAAFALQSAQARERTETMARQLSETQLQLLRAQIEPHMLFNTLANLRALIAVDPKAAQRMLDHLIDFFRASLDGSRREWSNCEREFKLAADYLALLAIRLGERLRFELDLPDDLRQQPLPSMLLQPLIENAIKHGIEPALRGGLVRVSAAATSGQLLIDVLDTGVGLPAQTAESARTTAFGNDQLRARLQTLYGHAAEFTLQPATPSGTLARIRLPLPARGPSTPTSPATDS